MSLRSLVTPHPRSAPPDPSAPATRTPTGTPGRRSKRGPAPLGALVVTAVLVAGPSAPWPAPSSADGVTGSATTTTGAAGSRSLRLLPGTPSTTSPSHPSTPSTVRAPATPVPDPGVPQVAVAARSAVRPGSVRLSRTPPAASATTGARSTTTSTDGTSTTGTTGTTGTAGTGGGTDAGDTTRTPPSSGTRPRPAPGGGSVVGIGTPTLPTLVAGTNPLQGRRLYADGQDWTRQQALAELTGGAADTVRALATVPQAKWLGPQDQVAWIADYVDRATAAGALPSLVLYAVPGRDCGSFSAGGFTSAAQYLDWVAGVRTAIAGRPAVVVVEPDALAQGSCSGTAADTAARLATLASAVDVLTADPGTAVYVDAGHEWWLTPQEAAARLVAAHVGRARGFSLDVSNFYATDGEVAFGQQVADLVRALDPAADPHFVVDTSRNGAGPAPAGPYDWCNPSGRLLGHAPGAVTGQGALDGYLWVKHPGESDGSCHPGDPASGVWFPAWADDLVARSVAAGALAVR